jgi:hypothetical protein
MSTLLSRLRTQSLVVRAAILAMAPLPVLLVVAPFAVHYAGIAGLAAAAVAAGLCLAGAAAALPISDWLREPCEARAGLWAGTIVRMGVPLIGGLAIHFSGGLLADGGLIYYLLVFYPVTLAAGTVLALPVRSESANRRTVPPATQD